AIPPHDRQRHPLVGARRRARGRGTGQSQGRRLSVAGEEMKWIVAESPNSYRRGRRWLISVALCLGFVAGIYFAYGALVGWPANPMTVLRKPNISSAKALGGECQWKR